MKRVALALVLIFAAIAYPALARAKSALPDIGTVLRAQVVDCARLDTPQRMPPGVDLAEGGYFCNAKGADFDVTFFELANAHHGEELVRLCTRARDKCAEVLIGRPHQRTLELIYYNAIVPRDWSAEAKAAARSPAGLDYEAAMQSVYLEAFEECKNLKMASEEPFIWVGRVSDGRVAYSMISSESKFSRCFQRYLSSRTIPPAPHLRRHQVKGGYPVEFVWQPKPAPDPGALANHGP